MTNETTQLARCPFCGGEAECIEFDGYRPSSPKTYRVSCNDEDCTMQSAEYRTEEDAIAAWNTRAESAELAALRQQVTQLEARNQRLQLTPAEKDAFDTFFHYLNKYAYMTPWLDDKDFVDVICAWGDRMDKDGADHE